MVVVVGNTPVQRDVSLTVSPSVSWEAAFLKQNPNAQASGPGKTPKSPLATHRLIPLNRKCQRAKPARLKRNRIPWSTVNGWRALCALGSFFSFSPGSRFLKCAKGEKGVCVLPEDPNHPQKVSSFQPSTSDFLRLN